MMLPILKGHLWSCQRGRANFFECPVCLKDWLTDGHSFPHSRWAFLLSLTLDLWLTPDTHLIDCTNLRRCVPFPSWRTLVPNTTTVSKSFPARAFSRLALTATFQPERGSHGSESDTCQQQRPQYRLRTNRPACLWTLWSTRSGGRPRPGRLALRRSGDHEPGRKRSVSLISAEVMSKPQTDPGACCLYPLGVP